MIQVLEQYISERVHDPFHLLPIPFLPVLATFSNVIDVLIQTFMDLLMLLQMISRLGKLRHFLG
jgi:hypothetical protein